jgi:DNA-directed RNA polymerase subunit M/transcription elongation factor TFIIS
MKFCQCGAMLDESTKTGELIFHCPKCGDTYPSKPNDSLIVTIGQEKKTFDIYKRLIRNAPHINCLPRSSEYCSNCKKINVVSHIRINDDYERLFICDCGQYWK